MQPETADPFSDPRWKALPLLPDAVGTLLAGQPLDEVYVGMLFTGDGLASATLHQIRIDFAHTTWLQYLPALYSATPLPPSSSPAG